MATSASARSEQIQTIQDAEASQKDEAVKNWPTQEDQEQLVVFESSKQPRTIKLAESTEDEDRRKILIGKALVLLMRTSGAWATGRQLMACQSVEEKAVVAEYSLASKKTNTLSARYSAVSQLLDIIDSESAEWPPT